MLCKYDIAETCRQEKDCAVCILKKVRNEITSKIDERYVTGTSAIYETCVEIIDKQIQSMC